MKLDGRFGIRNVVAWVDELKRLTDTAAKYDVSVDNLDPPFLPSSHIDREQHPAIMLGQSPERDRDIEQIQTMIKNCAAAKISVCCARGGRRAAATRVIPPTDGRMRTRMLR